MDNQLAQPGILVRRITLMALALMLAIGAGILAVNLIESSNPYVQKVLSLDGDVEVGKAMFQINCAGCHGTQAAGKVGPSLQRVSRRKSQIAIIHQVTDGKTPPMPKFQPSPQKMADLLDYLETL